MGFLSGAYGKLMAGKLVRDLQYQMTGVQSRLRRITREIGDAEKMFSAQEKNIKMSLQGQYNYLMQGALGGSGANLAGYGDYGDAFSVIGTFNNKQYSQAAQAIQWQFTQAQTVWTQMFEMQRDSMLAMLKDEEDSLQTEKDNLESRLKIAQAEYDAKKEEEKAGVKGLTPDYTGQG